MPATLTVTAGTTVTWTNDDTTPHTVTEQNRAFHSAALDTKDTFTYTFTTPGEFVYRCTYPPDDGRQDRRQARRQIVVTPKS